MAAVLDFEIGVIESSFSVVSRNITPSASVNPNHMIDQSDGVKEGALNRKEGDEKLALRRHSPDEAADTADKNVIAIPDPERPSWTAQCFGSEEDDEDVLKDLLNAVPKGWGRESELDQGDLTRFGLCPDPDGKSSSLHAALLALADSAEKDRGGLHIVHPTIGICAFFIPIYL